MSAASTLLFVTSWRLRGPGNPARQTSSAMIICRRGSGRRPREAFMALPLQRRRAQMITIENAALCWPIQIRRLRIRGLGSLGDCMLALGAAVQPGTAIRMPGLARSPGRLGCYRSSAPASPARPSLRSPRTPLNTVGTLQDCFDRPGRLLNPTATRSICPERPDFIGSAGSRRTSTAGRCRVLTCASAGQPSLEPNLNPTPGPSALPAEITGVFTASPFTGLYRGGQRRRA